MKKPGVARAERPEDAVQCLLELFQGAATHHASFVLRTRDQAEFHQAPTTIKAITTKAAMQRIPAGTAYQSDAFMLHLTIDQSQVR